MISAFFGKIPVVFVCFFICSSFVFTQDAPVKWGDIPRADLEMKIYAADTNAAAVILSDYGESSFNDEMEIVYKTHKRVKIITPNGFDAAKEDIFFHDGRESDRVEDVEGITYALEADGQVKQLDLKKKDIFEETVRGELKKKSFTMPGLKPGCVFEYRYTVIYHNTFRLPGWSFQSSFPTRWSEYLVTVPHSIAYAAVTTGYEQFAVKEFNDVVQPFQGPAAAYFGDRIVKCRQQHYVMENVPALKEEPFITTLSDYNSSVEFQLSAYAMHGGGIKHVLNTWEKLVEDLIDDKNFCGKIDNTRALRKIVDTVVAHCTTPEEKMIAIYNWVSGAITRTGNNTCWATQDINDVLDTKKGNNAEIEFLFISMLRYAGIAADPVLVSTRGNGKIQDLYPIISQFNYVLTRVKAGEATWFLDPTDAKRPYDLLPTKVLGVTGLVIKPEPLEWVGITSKKKNIESTFTNISLKPDGTIEGDMRDGFREYGAFFNRDALKDKKEIDLAKEFLETEKSGIQIDSVSVTGKDSLNVPFGIYAKISSSSYAQNNGDMIFLNPHILNRHRDNPFKTEKRKFAIDYGYGRDLTNLVSIVLPDSFEIKDGLPDRTFTAASKALVYTRRSQVVDGRFQVRYSYQVNENQINPNYYALVRDFYNQVVASESEQLVLTRCKPAAPPAAIAPPVEEPQNKVPAAATEKTETKAKKQKAK